LPHAQANRGLRLPLSSGRAGQACHPTESRVAPAALRCLAVSLASRRAAVPCLLLLASLPCRAGPCCTCLPPPRLAVPRRASASFGPCRASAGPVPGQCRAGPGQCHAGSANTTARQLVCLYDAQDCVWRTTCCNIAPSVATQDNAVCATLLAALPWRTPGDSATPGAYEPFSIGWLRVLTSARSCGSPHGPAA
jgi:hypothetical protein